MSFEARIDQHRVPMDANPAHGGSGKGPSPKQLVLAGICGCTGMDVVSILKKMRLTVSSFAMDADASQTEGYPAVFKEISLKYHVTGEELSAEKVIEAVRLSQTKYCGVSAMIAKSARIRYEVWVNSELVREDQAHF